MPVTRRKPYPGETVFGGGSGAIFLGRGSTTSRETQTPESADSSVTSSRAKPTAQRLTPEQIERALSSLRNRGVEIEQDDPMLYAAASLEWSLLQLAEQEKTSAAQSTTEGSGS